MRDRSAHTEPADAEQASPENIESANTVPANAEQASPENIESANTVPANAEQASSAPTEPANAEQVSLASAEPASAEQVSAVPAVASTADSESAAVAESAGARSAASTVEPAGPAGVKPGGGGPGDGEPVEIGLSGGGAPGEVRERSAAFRLAMFGALIVVVLFAGYGIGRLNNSVENAATPAVTGPAGHDMAGMASAAPHDDTGAAPHVHNTDGTVTQVAGSTSTAAQSVGGLAVTASGLTLEPASTSFVAGRSQAFSFKVAAAGGAPVTTYSIVHDKPLHLVVVRRDLSGFQHLHPTMAPDGTWSIDLTLAAPGSYRAIADFTAVVGGQQTPATLGVDLTAAGNYAPVALPAPATEATGDGFTVSYEGTASTAATQPIIMTVRDQSGGSVALQPYLGAYGHLVVLREGDVGYVHVHPEPALVDGAVKFWLAAPGPGRYRMFFDYQVAGKVHTAAFTTIVE
ncbi:hypothetical protein [Symbioplanes lichenis]|uniref:hypothetical protein n=1 Tax=Symbioplanes lichenis TaxID=1629072 RepID=UPI002738420B|nr:hypothetical protein [Actinoplanes lichenis]